MSRKKIAFISVARSDFGRLYPSLKAVHESQAFELQLLVSGNHNSEKFGNSLQEIEKSNIPITHNIPLKSEDMAERSTEILVGLNKWFQSNKADFFVILGDRFEMLAAAQSAFLNKIPLIHIGGGYQTYGAIDDKIRHAITQLSSFHFAATDKCRERVCELIGSENGVFLSGAPDLEILKNIDLMTEEEFFDSCGLKRNRPFILATVHPETIKSDQENSDYLKEFEEFLEKVDEQVLITAPCADPGAQLVFEMIGRLKIKRDDLVYIESLGMRRYATAMKLATMMIGNSSSGIIESASMGVPVLDLGQRQQGREINANVINSSFQKDELIKAYHSLKEPEFKKMCSGISNIYGNGEFSSTFIKWLNSL